MAGIKYPSGQMRQLYAYDANESIRRLVEDEMSRGLTNTHTARGILFYITCSLVNNAFSVLHYVIKVTLHYLTLHRFGIHWFFRPRFNQATASQPRVLSRRGCSLAIMSKEDSQILKVVCKISIRIQFVTTTGHTFPTKNCCSFF